MDALLAAAKSDVTATRDASSGAGAAPLRLFVQRPGYSAWAEVLAATSASVAHLTELVKTKLQLTAPLDTINLHVANVDSESKLLSVAEAALPSHKTLKGVGLFEGASIIVNESAAPRGGSGAAAHGGAASSAGVKSGAAAHGGAGAAASSTVGMAAKAAAAVGARDEPGASPSSQTSPLPPSPHDIRVGIIDIDKGEMSDDQRTVAMANELCALQSNGVAHREFWAAAHVAEAITKAGRPGVILQPTGDLPEGVFLHRLDTAFDFVADGITFLPEPRASKSPEDSGRSSAAGRGSAGGSSPATAGRSSHKSKPKGVSCFACSHQRDIGVFLAMHHLDHAYVRDPVGEAACRAGIPDEELRFKLNIVVHSVWAGSPEVPLVMHVVISPRQPMTESHFRALLSRLWNEGSKCHPTIHMKAAGCKPPSPPHRDDEPAALLKPRAVPAVAAVEDPAKVSPDVPAGKAALRLLDAPSQATAFADGVRGSLSRAFDLSV